MVTNVTMSEHVGLNFFVEISKSITNVGPIANKYVAKIPWSAKVHVVNQRVIVSMVSFVIVTEHVLTKMIALFVGTMNLLKMEYVNVKLVLPSMRMVFVKNDLGQFEMIIFINYIIFIDIFKNHLSCNTNEVWNWCGKMCEPVCNELSADCSEVCVAKCECDQGYIRDDEGNCITQEECIETVDVSPEWGQWSSWLQCSTSCGGYGAQTRLRECVGTDNPSDCGEGSTSEGRLCNIETCPTWTSWSSWSECSKNCRQNRVRVCDGQTSDLQCPGPSIEESLCTRRGWFIS